MGLFKKIQAGRAAKRLRGASASQDGSLGELQSELVNLGPEAVRSVLQSLRSVDGRQAAIEVLERLVNDSTLPVFLEALASPDPDIVAGVTTVLSNAKNYDPACLLALFENPRVSKARLETLLSAQMTRISPRTLIAALPGMSRESRAVVFRILEARADSTIVAEATHLATHSDWWLRLHMVKLLCRCPSPEGTATIVRLLNDENRSVRLEAVQDVGKLKAAEAIPALCQSLREPDIKIQTAAIDALIQIHDVTAVPHLIEVLKD